MEILCSIFYEMMLPNSAAGALFVLFILLFRKITERLSKLFVRILWILLLVELLAPPLLHGSLYTMRNLAMNVQIAQISERTLEAEAGGQADAGVRQNHITQPGESIGNAGAQPGGSIGKIGLPSGKNIRDMGLQSEESVQDAGMQAENSQSQHADRISFIRSLFIEAREFASVVWFAGVLILCAVYLCQFIRLRKKTADAVYLSKYGCWVTGRMDIPFVMPYIRPRIYLPESLSDSKQADILAHERQHIQNFDPLIKCLAAFAAAVHWFNPLVWAAYRLIGKDLEMYCDECVLRGKGIEERKRYLGTLLEFASKSSGVTLLMHFGESDTEHRIRHILYAKKPRMIVRILLVAAVAASGIFFLTSQNIEGKDDDENAKQPTVEQVVIDYGYEVRADIDGDGKEDRVSVNEIKDGNDAFMQVTAYINGLPHAQKDYEGDYASSFLMAGDLTGDGKADVLMVRYVVAGGQGRIEVSVLHLVNGRWEEYPGRFLHNPSVSLEQPLDFTDGWHDTYMRAAIVEQDGTAVLRFILLPDDKDLEIVMCIEASWRTDGWFIEDARMIEDYYADGREESLLGNAFGYESRYMVTIGDMSLQQDQKAQPKEKASDVDAVMKIIGQQAAAGIRISTNLADETIYTWTVIGNERRLTGIDWECLHDGTELTGEISFAGLPKLVSLTCVGNHLTSIDISSNTDLEYLNCGDNRLVALDVSQNTRLETLYCFGNRIAELDISHNTALNILNCGSNWLRNLDVSQNTQLSELSCNRNRLTELDIRWNLKLQMLNCGGNRLENLDVTGNQKLEDLWAGNNHLSSLDVAQNKRLGSLECENNQLTSLDVSHNAKLYYLGCGNNMLVNLDVSHNAQLGGLGCQENRLERLDVSRNAKLSQLNCCGNQLSELDVSQNSRMEGLSCSRNQLSALDVSSLTILYDLDCSGNQLSSLHMGDHGEMGIMENLNCEKNRLDTLDLSGIRLMEESVLVCDNTVKVIGL